MIKTGTIFETNNSGNCEVLEYFNSTKVRVRFQDGYETTCSSNDLRKGLIKNPNVPSVFKIGFVSTGLFSYKSNKNIYITWQCMLQRCYCPKSLERCPTYKQSAVIETWHNFQNFCYDYLQMSGHSLNWDLDKDILFKGNKLYSKETCCLIPHKINMLLIKRESCRGNLPIGVTFSGRDKNPFKASLSINGKTSSIGYFPTPELAFQAYKEEKESEIKRVANLYKFQLDPRVYKALINYLIEIDD